MTEHMPEKIYVKPPRVTMGERMNGGWSVGEPAGNSKPYIREDVHKAEIQRLTDELEAATKWFDVRDGQVPSFGDYVLIEQHRHGCDNEMYFYKVINSLQSNAYVNVPVTHGNGKTGTEEVSHDEMAQVVSCICCGVKETEVRKFRLCDVQPINSGAECSHDTTTPGRDPFHPSYCNDCGKDL